MYRTLTGICSVLKYTCHVIMHLKYTVLLYCSFPSPEPMPEGQRSDIPKALPPHSTKEDLDHHLEKQVRCAMSRVKLF